MNDPTSKVWIDGLVVTSGIADKIGNIKSITHCVNCGVQKSREVHLEHSNGRMSRCGFVEEMPEMEESSGRGSRLGFYEETDIFRVLCS